MGKPILIVEDDNMQRKMLEALLYRNFEYKAHEAANGRDALKILNSEKGPEIKLIIMDLNMPVMSGMDMLEILQQSHPSIPVIVLTGNTDIKLAVKAMKLGAIDFINKPYEAERMVTTIRNALKMSTLMKEVTRLKSEKEGRFTFENLIGAQGGLVRAVAFGRKAAASDIPVLVTGETGTGKEVFAKAIHGESDRAGRPFIAVNCGAIPAQLVESTLFGHEKGSFTGATEKVIGKFREAEGGTIFLDEVGELPMETQVKLLRVLQQKEVEPVGAGKPVNVNVRIVSATNRDLEKEIGNGNFREDLFFRLNVLQLELPTLRQRRQDIPELVEHFIERFSINEGGIPKSISRAALEVLTTFSWPGNVRQLENTINRAMVLSEKNKLDVEDFSNLVETSASKNLKTTTAFANASSFPNTIRMLHDDGAFKTIDELEQEVMKKALDHFEGNVTQTAKALGMAKSTFYKKMKDQIELLSRYVITLDQYL